MDLGGVWRASAGDEELRRTFHERDCDDSDWTALRVPGHWAEAPELAEEESVLFRRRFTGPDPGALDPADTAALDPADPDAPDRVNTGDPAHPAALDPADPADSADPAGDTGDPGDGEHPALPRRWWLRFEGLAQQGDAWLDGAYLGHTDGYFAAHEMEITEQVASGRDHVLAVEATCRRFGNPDSRATLTGALQDPELVGSDWPVVGGLWRPVRLRSSGPIAIRHARAVCADVRSSDGSGRPARARLALRAVLDAPRAATVALRTRVAGVEHVHSHPAAAGDNRVEWTVDVADPKLWWPHALGGQPLHDLTLEALTGSEVHDRRRFRIGFRKLRMRGWVLRVNGERIHLKGANLLPTRALLGTAPAEEVAGDVRAARSAGLDLVRPIAHVARPELYDAADELGMLVWQDLPVRGLMSRSVGGEARRQAREAVDLLGHRPSVAIWCAHDEPFARPRRAASLPPALSQQRPSWNRDVLDRWLCRVLDRCDGSRPVVAHTAVPPRLFDLDGTTSNVWLGRHGGRAADLGPALARVPRMGGFVSAFGTPAAADAPEVIETTVETLRRLKYRPNGGFLLHALADPADPPKNTDRADVADRANVADGAEHADLASRAEHAIPAGDSDPAGEAEPRPGFGVLDSRRRPKPAWQSLVDACRPLIVAADPLPPSLRPGSRINLAVHVVNDLRRAVDDLAVRARVIGPEGLIASRGWTGSVGADDCVLVGRIEAVVPYPADQPERRGLSSRPQLVVVELELTAEGAVAARRRLQAPIG